MAHSVLLSEKSVKVKSSTRKKTSKYPSWINEQSLMSVSIISFCTLLYFIGLHFAIVVLLGIALLLVQLKSLLSFTIKIDFSLNHKEMENFMAADDYLKE